ncbi:MAG: hypothetical protein V4487_01065 [Chlamydiota bacterium]
MKNLALFILMCAVVVLGTGASAAQPAPPPPSQPIPVPPSTQAVPPPQPTFESSPPEASPAVQKYWKFHKMAAIGYRRDRQSFVESQSRLDIKNRNSMMLMVTSHIEWRWLILRTRGSYGWLINGNADFNFPINPLNEPLSFKGYDLGAGYTADAQGTLGFTWKLYDAPSFGFSFIPGAGYRYSHMMNDLSGEKQSTVQASPSFARVRFPRPNQQDWFGPFVEGRIEFRFAEKAMWDLYYQYHFLDLRSKNRMDLDAYLYDPVFTLQQAILSQSNSWIHSDSARTQLGGTTIRVHLESGWTFGLFFEGSSTWTKSGSLLVKKMTERVFPTPIEVTNERLRTPMAVQWVNYSLSLFMGYKF